MSTTLVVMAAGRGSRFGGMKQVAPMGPSGEALFEYAVYDAVRAGFDRVVFVVSEESAGAVEAQASAGCGRHTDVRYVEQKTDGRAKPWGTGHAVLTATAEVDGPFGVINADDFYGRQSFERFLAGHADDADAEFLLGDAVSRMEEHGEGRVRVVPTPERFLGITYADDVGAVRQELAALVAAGTYPSPLWA